STVSVKGLIIQCIIVGICTPCPRVVLCWVNVQLWVVHCQEYLRVFWIGCPICCYCDQVLWNSVKGQVDDLVATVLLIVHSYCAWDCREVIQLDDWPCLCISYSNLASTDCTSRVCKSLVLSYYMF